MHHYQCVCVVPSEVSDGLGCEVDARAQAVQLYNALDVLAEVCSVAGGPGARQQLRAGTLGSAAAQHVDLVFAVREADDGARRTRVRQQHSELLAADTENELHCCTACDRYYY